MLRDAVVEKEVYDATKKVRGMIDGLLEGKSMVDSTAATTYGTWEDLPFDDEDTTTLPSERRRVLGPLQAETLPTDNPLQPFPGLEPPVG